MALPVFSFIAAPQDQMLVLPNGAINPAWHRFFLQLPALMPKLAEATTALTISAAYNQTEIQALETRVRAQAATINTLIARLEAAGVLEA